MNDSAEGGPSTEIRRLRERQSHDPEQLRAVLDDGVLAHVGFVRNGHPVVLPYLYGVGDLGDGAVLLLHGSTGAGMLLDGSDGGLDVSVGITHLDGLVFATNTFDSSANYRSAVVFGRATPVPIEHKRDALAQLSNHVMPGRRAEVRDMTDKEVAATQILQVPLDRVSVKIRAAGVGEAADDGEDHAVWSGVLPLAVRAGEPTPSPVTTATEPDASVTAMAARYNATKSQS